MAFWNRKRRQREEWEAKQLEEQMQRAQAEFDRRRQRKREAGTAQGEGNPSSGQDQAGAFSVEHLLEEIQGEEWMPGNVEECKRITTECCEAIREIEQQKDSVRSEYDRVSSRLTDIQLIDGITGEEREVLDGVCKKILRLTKERNQYANRTMTISDSLVRHFDIYEDSLADEVKKMYDAEMYQKAIEGDLEKLQTEKRSLQKKIRQSVQNQGALQQMAKVLIALIISLFALFVVIYYAKQIDMTLPYLGTILLAAVSATVIFLESGKNRRAVALDQRKVNKAITLLNRVKIKYINNRSLLDYNREKFRVQDAADFEKKWIEYHKAKEYERKFRENTKQLEQMQKNLQEILRERKVQEPELWLNQTVAIVDAREMVEIRHALNVQRGRLRERIAYNDSVRQTMLDKIDQIMEQNPDASREIVAIVQKYQ